MDGISLLCGVMVSGRGEVRCGGEEVAFHSDERRIPVEEKKEGSKDGETKTVGEEAKQCRIKDQDFSAEFSYGSWVVQRKWCERPPQLQPLVSHYKIPSEERKQFDAEIQDWMAYPVCWRSVWNTPLP
ncbi:hypothetical protein Ciccas_003220 [Cichlidogyrus casuarinus]|uniref:Uncharacterized protein n=1 Tax=Cichlidogyrus casuarinus TaxID=1844966 RepID=A0ABD2QI79_9PLAT